MLQAPAGQPPDVSARLLRICDMAGDGDSRGGYSCSNPEQVMY